MFKVVVQQNSLHIFLLSLLSIFNFFFPVSLFLFHPRLILIKDRYLSKYPILSRGAVQQEVVAPADRGNHAHYQISTYAGQ